VFGVIKALDIEMNVLENEIKKDMINYRLSKLAKLLVREFQNEIWEVNLINWLICIISMFLCVDSDLNEI